MGLMNLFVVSFGAFPTCHGSGDIAGKYAFGARTAGANVLVGMGTSGLPCWRSEWWRRIRPRCSELSWRWSLLSGSSACW